MTRICAICAKEFKAKTTRAKYCSPRCAQTAETRRSRHARRAQALRDAGEVYVMGEVDRFSGKHGTLLSMANPNVSSAQAQYELGVIYQQPHPLGQSLHN